MMIQMAMLIRLTLTRFRIGKSLLDKFKQRRKKSKIFFHFKVQSVKTTGVSMQLEF